MIAHFSHCLGLYTEPGRACFYPRGLTTDDTTCGEAHRRIAPPSSIPSLCHVTHGCASSQATTNTMMQRPNRGNRHSAEPDAPRTRGEALRRRQERHVVPSRPSRYNSRRFVMRQQNQPFSVEAANVSRSSSRYGRIMIPLSLASSIRKVPLGGAGLFSRDFCCPRSMRLLRLAHVAERKGRFAVRRVPPSFRCSVQDLWTMHGVLMALLAPHHPVLRNGRSPTLGTAAKEPIFRVVPGGAIGKAKVSEKACCSDLHREDAADGARTHVL